MLRYLGRRILRSAVLLLAVSALSFSLFQLAPGNFFDDLRVDPQTSAQTIEALKKQYRLNEPIVERYFHWLGSVLRGDWGTSLAYNTPIGPLLFERAGNTLLLTIPAAGCAWIMAVPFALLTASAGGVRRMVANSVVAFCLSLPQVVVLLALMALAAHFEVLPAGGMSSFGVSHLNGWARFQDLMLHMAVPLAALVLAALPTLFIHARAALVEALESPFVLFARANGISRQRLLIRHVLPAALNPMIVLFGLSVGTLLSSSLLVEAVSGWPGLGHLLLLSLLQRDLLVVAGAVLLSATFLIAGNLLADALLYIADPRIREESQ